MENNLSRRGFIELAALAGAASSVGIASAEALVPSEKAYAAEDEFKVVKTSCRGCISGCACKAYLRNGRLVKLEGEKGATHNDGHLCLKGLSQVQAVYHPNRLKYPMKRAGERGENKWERISWDEAIDTIARVTMENIKRYGGGSLLGTSGGGGSLSLLHLSKLIYPIGGWNTFEPGAAHCHAPRRAAMGLMAGVRNSLSMADGNGQEMFWEDNNTQALVIWGTNPTAHQTAGNEMALVKLRARGMKTVVIDPRFTADASKATVWLPIRPGTDVALALCFIHEVIDRKAYDEEFCLRWTNLPYLVNPDTEMSYRANEVFPDGREDDYVVWDKNTNSPKPMPYPWDDSLDPALEGTYSVTTLDGVTRTSDTGFTAVMKCASDWTIEKASDICWLDSDDVSRAIDIYIDDQVSTITHGVATDQYPQAQKSAQAVFMIEILMGHVEKRGVIFNLFGNGWKHIAAGPVNKLTEEACRNTLGTATDYRCLYAASAISHIPSVLEAMQTGNPYQIHVWLDFSLNKLSALAEPEKWVEASKRVDFIAQTCMYPTSFTYECVDIALPSSEWSEMNDLAEHQINQVVTRRRLVHLFETLDITVIMGRLAAKCKEYGADAVDLKDWYQSDEEKLAGLARDAMRSTSPKLEMTWEELCAYEDEHGYLKPMPDEEYRTYEIYKHIDETTGLPVGFPTKSRKLEAYGDCFMYIAKTGFPYSTHDLSLDIGPSKSEFHALPYYVEPAESPLTDTEYPLVMTSGRLPYFHHGTMRNNAYIRELYPVPELWINPVTATSYKIGQGSWVKVSSRRGSAVYRALVTEGINPGVVASERFWNPEMMQNDNPSGGWREINIQNLAKKDGPYCPEICSYTLRGFQVKIEPCDAPPVGVWHEPGDFEPWMPEYSDNTEVVY